MTHEQLWAMVVSVCVWGEGGGQLLPVHSLQIVGPFCSKYTITSSARMDTKGPCTAQQIATTLLSITSYATRTVYTFDVDHTCTDDAARVANSNAS